MRAALHRARRHDRMPLCLPDHKLHCRMSIDYSPTGREFVSGSYDRTLRIFPTMGGHSREIYHTKRMQRCYPCTRARTCRECGWVLKEGVAVLVVVLVGRIFCVKYTLDGKYVLSGSDEFNIRMWKAQASERLGTVRGVACRFRGLRSMVRALRASCCRVRSPSGTTKRS
jgi:WD repeat and SOF domain-containing protein 1